MIETNKIYLIRHAPVKKIEGYVPKNDPNAIINPDHFKSLALHIPDNSICYVSPLKRAIQTAHQLSKFINLRKIIIENVSTKNWLVAIILWFVPLPFVFPLWAILFGFILNFWVIFVIGKMSQRKLNGITGDILGATAFTTELVFLLGLTIYLRSPF